MILYEANQAVASQAWIQVSYRGFTAARSISQSELTRIVANLELPTGSRSFRPAMAKSAMRTWIVDFQHRSHACGAEVGAGRSEAVGSVLFSRARRCCGCSHCCCGCCICCCGRAVAVVVAGAGRSSSASNQRYLAAHSSKSSRPPIAQLARWWHRWPASKGPLHKGLAVKGLYMTVSDNCHGSVYEQLTLNPKPELSRVRI